ncbi:hypothetical protein Adt_31326 [Abeliophyllum distichum]|uniref:Uncharacterized protein n=1 Tax=Abeliophyllum distichum TaxID=126358 RepID=A0ABD1RDT2_9LAMI
MIRTCNPRACDIGTSLAQVPLPPGLGTHTTCSIQRNEPRSSASPTGTRHSACSIQRNEHRSSASPTGTRHSACSIQRNEPRSSASPTGTRQSQLVPSKGMSLAQVPLPPRLGIHTACFIQRNEPRSSASPTGTRQSLNLLHSKERASLKCLSHRDSALTQLVPSKGMSLTQVPLPLGLGNHSTCSIQRNEPRSSASPTGTRQSQLVPSKGMSLAQVPLPPGLGTHTSYSIQMNEPRSSASPTGTRQSLNLLHSKLRASLKCLSHRDSTLTQLVLSKGMSLAQVPLPLGLDNHSTCSIQRNEPRSSASPIGTRHSHSLFHPKE